jgi:hypothetical protein
MKWYEIPYMADDSYYDELFYDIIAIVDEKTADEVYGLLSGWVFMNNKILSLWGVVGLQLDLPVKNKVYATP